MLRNIIENNRCFIRRLLSGGLGERVVVRKLKDALLRVYFRLASNKPSVREYKPLSITNFSIRENVKPDILIDSENQETPSCKFYMPRSFSPRSAQIKYKSEICAAYEFQDVVVLGRSDFIFKNNLIVHDDWYSPENYVSTLEQFNLGQFTPAGRYKILANRPNRVLGRCISLLSGGAGNYAHLITEIIPKLVAINDLRQYDGLPILVDKWIGLPLLKVIIFFNKDCREIIAIDQWERVLVRELVYLSSPSAVPQDFKANFSENKKFGIAKHTAYRFSSTSLRLVRDYALSKVVSKKVRSAKLIYLRRKPEFSDGIQYNTRSIINDDQVLSVLSEFGFRVIDPGSMSFEEQVATFSECNVVVSPLGAALANMIFSKPGTKVIGLGAYYINADYAYFANLLSSIECSLSYVLGGCYNEYNKHPMHQNYFVDIDSLRKSCVEVCGVSALRAT